MNGTYLDSFGLDRLLQRTLKRCKKALLGDMRKIMINQTTSHIKDKLKNNNKRKKESIIKIMKSDAVDDDLANKNIEDFLCRIYRYNISKYLDVNDMGNATYSLIRNSQFKEHRINFFANCQKYENSIIESVLPSYAFKFLDNQATKEKEYKIAVEYINKRNYLDFMNTTKKFLEDNFNYFSSKYYIYYIINTIFEQISTNFENELNNILTNLMYSNEIQKQITQIFMVKFNEFEKRVFLPYCQNTINNPLYNYDDEISEPNRSNNDTNSGFNGIIQLKN